MTTPAVARPAVTYERVHGITVRATCPNPNCSWHGTRLEAAATWGWLDRLAADLATHTCTNRETPS